MWRGHLTSRVCSLSYVCRPGTAPVGHRVPRGHIPGPRCQAGDRWWRSQDQVCGITVGLGVHPRGRTQSGSRAPTAQCHPPLTHTDLGPTFVPRLEPLVACRGCPARPPCRSLRPGCPSGPTAVPGPPSSLHRCAAATRRSPLPSSLQPHRSHSRCRCRRHRLALSPLLSPLPPVHSPGAFCRPHQLRPPSGCSRSTPPWASPQSPRSGHYQSLCGLRPPLPPLCSPFVTHTYLRAYHSHQRSLRGSHVHWPGVAPVGHRVPRGHIPGPRCQAGGIGGRHRTRPVA